MEQGCWTFWARIERGTDTDCWPWIGTIHKASGYGHFKHKGACYKAHRVAYALTHGGLEWTTGKRGSHGLLVLHRCDNRRCCNPGHLFLGTQRLATTWSIARTHGHVKLTVDDVAAIKSMEAQGLIGRPGRGWSKDTRAGRTLSLATVGKRFGVSSKTIEQVLRRRAWVGVGEPAK